MKLLLALTCLVSVAFADYCYNDVISACKPAGGSDLVNCNAKYGKADSVAYDLQSFANKHITHSFQYLLLSTHFGNFEKNRAGFQKLFRKLSDTAWNDGIDLIKYMTKRGVTMDFLARSEDKSTNVKDDTYELYELESLSKSLDIQKSLAEEAHRIHTAARDDAEVMSHMENTFTHKFRDSIRELSGHTNDLKELINNNKQSSLNVYLFDEYLQKLY